MNSVYVISGRHLAHLLSINCYLQLTLLYGAELGILQHRFLGQKCDLSSMSI
jgi:hypothetical protein